MKYLLMGIFRLLAIAIFCIPLFFIASLVEIGGKENGFEDTFKWFYHLLGIHK